MKGPGVLGAAVAAGHGIVAAQKYFDYVDRKRQQYEYAQSYQSSKDNAEEISPPGAGVKMATKLRGKARYSRRRRPRRKYRRVSRTVQPFSVVRTMKSVVPFSMNPTAGALSQGDLYLNSANDPTGGVAAGQPLGYDQMTALYNKCCVVGWSVKIEWCTSDNTVPVMVGFTPTTSSSALTSFSHYKELPGTKSMIITPDIDKGIVFCRGGVKRYFVPPGGKLLSNENLVAAVGGNPTNILHGHIWAQAMDATADPGAINVVVTVWQRVVFFDPVIPARS